MTPEAAPRSPLEPSARPKAGVIANGLFVPHTRSGFAFVIEAVATHLANGGRNFAITLPDGSKQHFQLPDGIVQNPGTAVQVAKCLTQERPLGIDLIT